MTRKTSTLTKVVKGLADGFWPNLQTALHSCTTLEIQVAHVVKSVDSVSRK